ncbi:MAG: response regulator transcription factor [Bacteroidales bacterium]|nr:response regulator transcription factor [Bacteroidales bacterium]
MNNFVNFAHTFQHKAKGSPDMKKKVLLVDDIKEFRSLVKIILSGNYEVVTAEDGKEAIDLIKSGLQPDVIVTDLLMPRVDGFQLISTIKNGGGFNHIPVIVLSNVDEADERKKLLEQGVHDYIIKPFSTKELKEGLGRTLDATLSN